MSARVTDRRRLVAAIDQGTTEHAAASCSTTTANRSRATSSSTPSSRHGPAGSSTTPTRSSSASAGASAGALREAGVDAGALAAIGVSNQRETTVVWDRRTGRPADNAIVWQDTRTAEAVARLAGTGDGGIDRFRATTGLPISTYSSALKLRWILDRLEAEPSCSGAGEPRCSARSTPGSSGTSPAARPAAST